MPRIRTLKPEHKQHRKVGPLSHFAYRLWVGLITEADDEGRVVADPEQLRALVFPYHPKERAPKIQTTLEALFAVGLLHLYTTGGVQYVELPSWRDHQRVSHPYKSKLPGFHTFRNPPEHSGTFQNIPEHSTGIRSDPSGVEGSGSDPRGEESEERGNGAEPPRSGRSAARPRKGDYDHILGQLKADHPGLTEEEAGRQALRILMARP